MDVVHAFHARRAGPEALRTARRRGLPLVLTLTGTDTDLDVHHPGRRDTVTDVIRGAAAIVCGHVGARHVAARLRGSGARISVVPKGVLVPDVLPPPAEPPDGTVHVLLVGHVRPVKNIGLAVRAVGELAAQGFPIRLRVLGDVLDREEDARLAELAGGRSAWDAIRHAAVSPADVGAWYAWADVVLNTSHGEGGSNAVLEAMAHGRAVLASGIPGNVQYVGDDGSRGVVYPVEIRADGTVVHDEDVFVADLLHLATDADARARLGAAARAWVARTHDPEHEIDGVLAAYASAITGASGTPSAAS